MRSLLACSILALVGVSGCYASHRRGGLGEEGDGSIGRTDGAIDADGGDASLAGADGALDGGGVRCGSVTCSPGEVCCSERCSACGPAGSACPDIDCRLCESTADCTRGTACVPVRACEAPRECHPMVCFDGTPVCGCDDRDYRNACEAWRAGVGVAYDGRCRVVYRYATASPFCFGTDRNWPGWWFWVTEEPSSCDGLPPLAESRALHLGIVSDLDESAPRTFTLRSDRGPHEGALCGAWARGCGPEVLAGEVTVERFASGSDAALSYSLTDTEGNHYASDVVITTWCGEVSRPVCDGR